MNMGNSKFNGYNSNFNGYNSRPIKTKGSIKEEISGESFLNLKMSYLYKVTNIKTQKSYKLLIINPLNNYYQDGDIKIELYRPFQEGHFYTDYYCYDVENENFIYLTETCENLIDLFIEEINSKELNKNSKFVKLRKSADYLYRQQAKTNKRLNNLRDEYLERYQKIIDTSEDDNLLRGIAENCENLAFDLLNSSEGAMSVKDFEQYLYSCLSPDVRTVLSTPHKYHFSFSEEYTGDYEEKKIYRLMIEREIKIKKDKNSLKCIVKDEYRGDIRYNLDKEHPEYQLLLTKERTTEGPYITNIGFRETPMGIGGSYAQGQFMDSLYLVDYRNRCYKRTRKSEGLYYHIYLLMYEYKPFKLTKENAEIIAKSIYLSK